MSNSTHETLIGLVSIYSPSGHERGAVEWLVARMKSLGYDNAYMDEVGNAVGVMGQGTKQVILLGHIDTVPGEIPVRVENVGATGQPQLYGRGSVDAKGPLACFVDAVAQVRAVQGWQFVVIGAVEEERDSEGRVMLRLNIGLILRLLANQIIGIVLRLGIKEARGQM